MARWLRDAETGELFREDELDAGSYEQLTDFQPIAPQEPQTPEYEFPTWLTSGLGTSIPARTVASLVGGGSSINEMLGDLASNIPGLEDNLLQQNARQGRALADALVEQARRDNQITPGSFQDIAGSIAGEIIPSLGTLGYGLARGAGKAALSVAPALMPSANKYTDLTDKGVSGADAGLAAAGSLALNSLLNRFDVGAALNPLSSPAKRIGQTALVGGATNALGAVGDAYLDKQAGAPQSRDEFFTNLLAATGAGVGTGAGFGAMGALGRTVDTQVADGQDINSLMSRMEQSVPEVPAQPRQSLTLDSDIPIVDRRAPTVDPLIQVEEAYRARDLAGQQRRLEDLFLPEDSELAPLRESPPDDSAEVVDIQRTTPANKPLVKSLDDSSGLTPLELEAANKVRSISKERVAKAQVAENEAGLRELLDRRAALRGQRVKGTDGNLTLKVNDQNESFPLPIIKTVAEASERPATSVELPPGVDTETSPLPLSLAPDRLKPEPPPVPTVEPVEVYQSRTPPEVVKSDPLMDQVSRLTQGDTNFIPDSEVPIIGQEAAVPEPQELVRPDSVNERPGSVWVDPASDIGRAREAGRRLVNAQRQEAPSIIPVEVYRAKTERKVARIKPKGTAPDDLRNALGKRAATRRKRAVTSNEAGFGATWLVDLFVGPKAPKEIPGYKDWSDSNKRYADGSWGRRWEWMDTTKRKEPASANFIDGQWRIPQDTHAIVWDADETLAPYKSPELTPKEKQGVNNYLQAARILGSKDKGYKVSAETASAAGLNPKQVEAALSVKRWSDFYADIFENDSLAQAEHYATIETLKAPNDQYKAAIAQRLEETKTKIAETFKQWRDSNYVPFDRYGEHYVNVFAPDGTLLAREQFESKDDPGFKKAIAHYQQLAKQPGDFAGATVKPGRQDPKQLLQDFEVNQDILDILGADGSGQPIAGFSRHFKNAKLIPGYNRDLDRAITDYTVGAARLLAFRRANRVAEMELATTLAGDDKINLRNKLIEFKDSLNNPRGEGAKLLNEYFNFAFIGGNARVAVADTLGFFQMQPMVLSKYLKGFDTEKVELKTYGNLLGYYFGRKLDDGMSAGIKEAQRKGLIPTETFKSYLRARRGPSDTMKAMTTVKDAYFSLKALSERTVDAGAFMSGWEAWKRLPANVKRSVSQQQFAENMIREMKAVPSQMELPPNALFKTETGRLVSKFRLYQVKLAKTIAETPMPGKLRGAMRMFLTVGLSGLPLVGKEAFTALRTMGIEPEDKLREAGFGSGTMYGPLSSLSGVDFSGSAGFGEVFPSQAENPFTKFTLGMLGAPAEAGLRAAQYLDRGQTRKAVASLPISNLLSNYLNQADWGERGVVTMGGQAVIPRDEVQGIDRLKKLAGFQPLRVKEAMVKENRLKQAEAKAKDTDFINQRIGEAVGLGNLSEALALRQEARAKGIKVNENSVKDYANKIRGIRVKIPKKAKQEVMKVEDLYD